MKKSRVWKRLRDQERMKLLEALGHEVWERSLRLEWALKHHRNTHREHLSFKDKLYLVDLYLDHSDRIAVMKSVQCGVTEWLILEALTLAERGYSVLYILPTYVSRNTFVPNRVDRLIMSVDEYNRRLHPDLSDNLSLKHFSMGVIKFGGSNTPNDFKEFPADAVLVDELDRCVPDTLFMAGDRLAASLLAVTRLVSNPSMCNVGIHSEYEKTDKKRWFVRCSHCGERQPLDWFTNVVRRIDENRFEVIDSDWKERGRDVKVYCRKCEREIEDRWSGEWVAENPSLSKEKSGYHISKLFTHQTTIRALVEKFFESLDNEIKYMVFLNSELGLPYDSSLSRGKGLSQVELRGYVLEGLEPVNEFAPDGKASIKKEKWHGIEYAVKSNGMVGVGVDVGRMLNIVVVFWPSPDDERCRILNVLEVGAFDELKGVLRRYSADICVIDAMPDIHAAKEFQQKIWGEVPVWLVRYHSPNVPERDVFREENCSIDYSEQEASVPRTGSIDNMVKLLRSGQVLFPERLPDEFYEHMSAPARVEVNGNFRWEEGNSPDHYFHAFNYALLSRFLSNYSTLRVYM